MVEGLTEFLPISSTGHLILISSQLAVDEQFAKLFNVVIQFGAVLAIVVLYWRKFWGVLIGLPRERSAQIFTRNILLAFLPAMVIGYFAHGFIKEVLFSPQVVAIALVIGGLASLVIEKKRPAPTIASTEELSWKQALAIGFFQCIAMIPGTSRSGASIMGALLIGLERKAAAEFSFFLAVPTMLAAASYDLYKNMDAIPESGWAVIAAGFFAAFITALLVVRAVMGFIPRHGFMPFAYYRIVLGLVIGALILTGHFSA
jgi:undecaprenyl-diphosphatase